jgi:predicted metal-dependent peptidase
MFASVPEDTIDLHQLTRELDRTKSAVFLGSNAAFLGSLMCSLTFSWTRDIETAATNGIDLYWNPDWFKALPQKTRESVLLHELWHVARLHMVRLGTRDPKTWNIACDARINNDLENEGYTFGGTKPYLNHDYDLNGIAPEEDIYDLLSRQNPLPPAPNGWGGTKEEGDILPPDNAQKQAAVNAVVQAVQSAKMMGQAGNIPGDIEETLRQFLEPVIPWEVVLMQFFTDLLTEDYSWRRPNRRYCDMYLPSRFTDDGRLEHLAYYLDVSGSITKQDILRFNSEVKYIQTVLKPQRLTLVQFDTRITAVKEFQESDPFDEIRVIGRGGTCLVPVREHIRETEPTAAIIFSDLCVKPMEPLGRDTPVIWVATGNPGATVPFGKLIHIN